MSENNPIETSFTWDHETHQIWIDTNHRPTKSRLKKLKLKPVSTFEDKSSYITDDSKLSMTFKRKRVLSPEHIEKLKKNMKAARESQQMA